MNNPPTLEYLRLAAKLQAAVIEARKSPIGLYKFIFSADDGSDVIIKSFHEEWNRLVLEYDSVLIEASRGLSKTTFLICVALWYIGTNPNIRIKWLSQDDPHAHKRLKVIRKYIKESELYQLVFPEIKIDKDEPNNVSMLTVVRDTKTPEPTVEARGVLSASSGDRADIIIGDDVCDYRNTIKDAAYRPQVIDKMLGDWFPTLNPRSGRRIFIFTPWHAEDLHSYLKTTGTFKYSCFHHGTEDDPYYSIFEELYTPDYLKSKRVELGAFNYARAYLCKLQESDSAIVYPEQLVVYGPNKFNSIQLTPEKLNSAIAILSLDPAKGEKADKGNLDLSGLTVFLLSPVVDRDLLEHQQPYELFIPESFEFKLPQLQQVKLVSHLFKIWMPSAILVEAAAMQSMHIFLQQDKDIPSDIIYPVTPTKSKGERLMSAATLLQPLEGHPPIVGFHPEVIHPFPKDFTITLDDGTTVVCKRKLRHQLLNFPTSHDDVMDSFTQGVNWIKRVLIPQLVMNGSISTGSLGGGVQLLSDPEDDFENQPPIAGTTIRKRNKRTARTETCF